MDTLQLIYTRLISFLTFILFCSIKVYLHFARFNTLTSQNMRLKFLPLAAASLSLANPTFLSALNACPAPCDSLQESTGWTAYRSVNRLAVCNETMLLDFALHSALDGPKATPKIYACVPHGEQPGKQEDLASSACSASNETEVTMELASSGSTGFESASNVIEALQQIQKLPSNYDKCNRVISFGYSRQTAVGLYVGGGMHHESIAESLIPKLADHIEENGVSDGIALQSCGEDADRTVGIVADTKDGLVRVQKAVKRLSQGQCATGYEHTSQWSVALKSSMIMTEHEKSNGDQPSRQLLQGDTCDYIKVQLGDSCGSLASRCGISGNDFEEYNDKNDLCSTLAPGQIVCCSEGKLPDLSPDPNDDGSCASYKVLKDDTCAGIAASNSIEVDELKSYNSQTWGWAGCQYLAVGMEICLSEGDPPMPAPISNAVCGPQVPGTERPTDGTKLADLNPCKLNACCDIWGQCGVTDEFCTKSESETGAPGTAAPGENGCISNCGTDIVNKGAPDSIMRVAYFEAWNYNRDCLFMDVSAINTTIYTHIHFAFANITEDYEVDVAAVDLQFQLLKDMKGIKRILSFGGWSFSTSMDTYPIFRQGVTDANRQKFANNVVNFAMENDLDGLDFDWEYPSAPDIPGIPPGSPEDGENYVKFLKMVREALPDDKSLSIAAPASYWYLKGFDPITDFEPLLDYMIYMTYDLHGQWDYGNPWSVSGCPAGNCLRSHVNYTETLTAMSMITKAGIPTRKVIMGTSLYGRSFKMIEPGCSGPMCTFVGPESAAAKGRCTDTAGYIAQAEIKEIIATNPTAKTWRDEESKSDILVYNETEWVAYMDESTRGKRFWKYIWLYTMGGISDWAVDLKEFYTIPEVEYRPCDGNYDTLQDIKDDLDNIQDHCVAQYSMQILSNDFQKALDKYHELLEDGYDDKFKTYADYIKGMVYDEIEAYMLDGGADHWSCVAEVYVQCCADCGWMTCSDGCDSSCGEGESGYQNKTADCPTSRPERTINGDPTTIYWHLEDEDAFLKAIAEEYGIQASWITYTAQQVGLAVGCSPGDHDCGAWWFGYPTKKEHIEVPNPKDVISSAMTNLTIVQDKLAHAVMDAQAMVYMGSTLDVVTASELPVFMTEYAVDSMKEVADAAEEIEEAQKKRMILNFVMAILMVIPAVGEAAASVGLATIGRIIIMTGALGDAAFGVYGVVEDPQSAVISLFAALVGLRGGAGFSEAAKIRRGMSKKEISALGSSFKDKSDLLHSIQKTCKA